MATDATRAEFFYFTTQLRLFDTSKAGVTIAFCAERQFDRDRLGEGLKAAVAYPNDPALIILIGLEPNAEAFEELVPEMEAWAPPGVKIVVLLVDSQRRVRILGNNPGAILEPGRLDEYVDAIFEAGLWEMFHAVPTVIRSSPGYHFEAPGGKHMTTFVRTGNMFIDSARSSFAATSMLDKVGALDTIQLVSTDTSSINAVAYELRRLQEMFFPNEPGAVVGSFGGHRALDERVSLGTAKGTLFLLSVSSTGALTKRVLEERAGARVVVLIALGLLAQGAAAMFSPDRLGSLDTVKLESIESVDRRHCPRCTDYNETVVKIDGEQLLPLAPSVFSRLITRKHAFAWHPEYLEAMVLLDSVEAHHVPTTRGTGASRRPIYFGFESFFSTLGEIPPRTEAPAIGALRKETLAKLDTMLDELKPTHIVHLPDPSSLALAVAAQKRAGKTNPHLVDSRAARDSDQITSTDENRILVIASAASSGSALNSLSRDLRPIVVNSIVCYFVFMPRTQDEDTWFYLRSNLQIGLDTGPKTKVEEVASAWLPSEKTLLGSVWDDEIEFWGRLVESFERIPFSKLDVQASALAQIDERRSILLEGGLRDNLFLNSSADMNGAAGRLRLEDNFALWKFKYDKNAVNQAAVYLTFAAVLDWTRSPGGGKDHQDYHDGDINLELEKFFDTTQRQHNLTALHPFNFDRYNDPVTNSALLRSALPWELDYSVSPGLSASMLAVLDGVVDSYSGQGDSALVEFLLALAAQRLRLHPKHLDLLVERLAVDLPPVGELLVAHIVRSQIEAPLEMLREITP